MTSIDVGHRCRARDHCVARVADGSAVTPAPNTICNGCARRLQEQLQQLPHFIDALQSFKRTSLVSVAGSKVNSTPTPSAPANLAVVDLITEIWRVISRAGGGAVRIDRLINEPAEEYPIWRGGRLRDQLLDGVDRALAIGEVWRKADSMVGLSRQWVRRLAPCLRCNLRTLGMFAGEGTIHCTNSACRSTYSLDEFDRLCRAKAEIEKIEKKEKGK